MGYPSIDNLAYHKLCRFTKESGKKPNCSWYVDSVAEWYVGTVNGNVWKYIEDAWSNDSYGNWTGAPPTLVQPINLVLIGDDGEEYLQERQGDDDVYLVGTGESPRAMWLKQTLGSPTGSYTSSGATITVYDAATGLVAITADSPTMPWSLGGLADGSYTVHVKYNDIQEGLRVPPDAVRLPSYDYETGDGRISHYNPYENWGEVPADPNHPLRLLRQQIVASNLQRDVPEWAYYLTSEEPRDGEGAMVKVQVGGGTWAVDPGVFVSPARPLHVVDFGTPDGDFLGTPVEVPFDPMAAQITFYYLAPGGTHYLGGTRMDGDGTHPALWEWDPATATGSLLGVAFPVCRALCEERLSTGGVTGLIERADGVLILLTLCSRHRYDPNGELAEDRLPRYPIALDGEPGGRSLVHQQDTVYHLTESFGRQPDPDTLSFYNVMVKVTGEKLTYAAGTLAHVESALWEHQGRIYGIRADAIPGSAQGSLYIAFNDGNWNKGATSWDASKIFLSRGCSSNGMMLSFGFTWGEETAQAVRRKGSTEEVLALDHRVRGLFLSETSRPGYSQVGTSGHEVLNSTELSEDWSVIAFTGYTQGELPEGGDPDPGGDDLIPDDPDPPDVWDGPTILYRVLRLPASSYNPVYGIHCADLSSGKALTAVNLADDNGWVRARVDSSEDIDAFDSYNYMVPLGQHLVLRQEAYEHVDVIIFWDSNDGALELPAIASRS